MSESAKYRALVDHSLTGIIIVTSREIRFANPTFEQITGYDQTDIKTMHPWDMVHPSERESVRQMGLSRLDRRPVREYYETRWIKKDGTPIWVEVRAIAAEDQGEPAILANVVDITERKRAEEALKLREAELAAQAKSLEEANIALKVLLKRRDEDRAELEERVLANVNELVLPFLEEIRKTPLSRPQKAYLQIIESNLREIVSPFSRNLFSRCGRLTPREMEIVHCIKTGQTSKEIAAILNVSRDAVDFHRNNIRKKLGLNKEKVNLRSFLINMT